MNGFSGMAFLVSLGKIVIMKNNNTESGARHPFKGNANGNPAAPAEQQPAGETLLDKKAEEYLREGGKIEDYPNEREEQEADRKLRDSEAKTA
ncbi:MAG: hypothetical protein ACO1OO_05635 [Flavisolibacter sp.]